MKIIGFLVLLALLVIGYGYFFDHSILKQIGLGSLTAADDAAQAAAAAPPPTDGLQVQDSKGLVKCVDRRGHITFSDHACPEGQKSRQVSLSATEIVHLGPQPANPQAASPGSQNKDSSQQGQTVTNIHEDHKVNAQGAIEQKFFPQ